VAAKRRPNKIVAIDWDVRSLRIVHASAGKRGVKIDRILAAPIPPGVDTADPSQLGPHIRKVLDQEGIGTRHTVVDIPREQVILKALSLPAIRAEELPGVVEIQIAKELPFAAGEGVIDFVAGSVAADGNQEVLVSVVRRELLQQYLDVLAAAGLKPDRVGLRPYANKVAVCELLRFGVPDRVLFVEIRSTLTEIDVIRSSALAFSRAASVMVPHSTETPSGGRSESPKLSFVPASSGEAPRLAEPAKPADAVLQSLLVEVTRSIEAYRVNDAGAQMDHAVVAGDTGVEEALAEAIQKRLGITTELYNPASSFGWDAEEGAAACGFSAALGLVLNQSDTDQAYFDFLHPKRVVSAAKERLRKAPMAAAAAVLFIIAGVGFVMSSTRDERAQLAQLKEEIAELEGVKPDYEKFLKFANEIRTFDADQHVWVDVLYEIFSLLPANDKMVLLDMDMNQADGRVTLKTKAVSSDTATEVVRSLQDYRREGSDSPRFQAGMGAQTNKPGEKYPFWQDLRITVVNDAPKKKKPSDT
jgi:type IV pilus assembly protein PilM